MSISLPKNCHAQYHKYYFSFVSQSEYAHALT